MTAATRIVITVPGIVGPVALRVLSWVYGKDRVLGTVLRNGLWLDIEVKR